MTYSDFASNIVRKKSLKILGKKLKRLTKMCFLNLRAMIFWMMLFVAAVPTAIFYSWVSRTSLENEISQVDESHLIIAKNLSLALSRYSQDAIAVFDFVVSHSRESTSSYPKLLPMFDIREVMLLDADNQLILQVTGGDEHTDVTLDPDIIAELRLLTAAKPGEIVVSGLRQYDGAPHFFIAQLLADGTVALAPWSTRYVIELQQSIAFGELGHSMMVDHQGLVVAHPNPEWQRVSKDASGLSVVQAMLEGRTGVMQFYSPPMDADMIAGYTYVPTTGWGVMVPQPIRELEANVDAIKTTAFYTSALVIALSAIVGLLFSKHLTRSIVVLVGSAKRVARGDFSARPEPLPRYTPYEITNLAHSFDEMTDDIREMNGQLTQSLLAERTLSNERAHLLTEAERANAAKSEFVATISHELRTPLTSIKGSIDLVQSGHLGALDSKAEKMLAVGQKNVERLLSLVGDILDFSGSDAGQLKLDRLRMSADQILSDAEDINLPLILDRNVTLVRSPTTVPFDVFADQIQIQKVISNLISNAVKFSAKGGVVEVSTGIEGDFGVFRVKDSGVGISEKFWPTVFDRFTQEDGSDTRKVGGAGIGLAIAKSIVESHGGTIYFETEIGVGTTFSFTVPLAYTRFDKSRKRTAG
jgi:signal transduction histidine kinase